MHGLGGEPVANVPGRCAAGVGCNERGEVDAEIRDGAVVLPPGHMLQLTVHRHGRIPAKPQAGLIAGWGEWTGAIATSVSHDTHNLVVFGRDPHDMAAAANRVIADGGGVAVARGGEVAASIALPIAGLLSPLPAPEVAAAQRAVTDAAHEIGLDLHLLTQPLFHVMLAALACIPGPHVTDLGLIDGTTGQLIPSPILT